MTVRSYNRINFLMKLPLSLSWLGNQEFRSDTVAVSVIRITNGDVYFYRPL